MDARIINTTSGAGLNGSMAQSAYSAAKGGIATLTLVQAAELGRYGITANALAPAARTRMTEQAFADKMKRPDTGFDAQDPDNIAPAVVWLGSSESREVTGCVFELEGGKIMIDRGWSDGPADRQAGPLAAAEVGAAVTDAAGASVPPPEEGLRDMSTPRVRSRLTRAAAQPARRQDRAGDGGRRHRDRLRHRQAALEEGARVFVSDIHERRLAEAVSGCARSARTGGRQAVRRHVRGGRAGAGAHGHRDHGPRRRAGEQRRPGRLGVASPR